VLIKPSTYLQIYLAIFKTLVKDIKNLTYGNQVLKFMEKMEYNHLFC
jgi:hypothetical protein